MKRVWIAQCLCPDRHAIAATADEAVDRAEAEIKVRDPLRERVAGLLREGAINPWCGLCNAPSETWVYEIGRTAFRSMAEALPALRENQRQQARTRAVWGDLHKTGTRQ